MNPTVQGRAADQGRYRPDLESNPYLDPQAGRREGGGGGHRHPILLVLLSLALGAMALAMLLSPNAFFSPTIADVPTAEGAAIVEACHEVPSPGENLCAQWVSEVYDYALGIHPWGDARDMYRQLDAQPQDTLEPGMALAVSTHPHTDAGREYGHIGIYVGDGRVMDNVGTIRTTDLAWWVSHYGASVPVRFGWLSA